MTPLTGGLPRARELLAAHFGFPAFRLHQLRVLGPLLAGRHVLAVLPTGAGKSLCFQIPALMNRGLTLVVSPLVSLMQDQVGALRRRQIPAAYLNGTLSAERRRLVLAATMAGAIRILYCAPERLASLVCRLHANRMPVDLLAVDEAHCIVEWGNEFRPAYRALGKYRYLLGDPLTVALTGSATPNTRREIVASLRLRDAHEVISSFDRPNLRFAARRMRDDTERFAEILRRVKNREHPTIIYTPTRRLAELVTRALLRRSLRAAPYHAGLTPRVRRQVLRAFLQDELTAVVATTAFGMGIDKPDVRQVLHWGPARTLESYYQEAGRAGRDGGPADCVILWRARDLTWPGIAPAMRHYVEQARCRRRMLLEYFGESPGECAGCDICG
jgi:ATP-dependent DNA helicase RecQ